jgi:N-acetylmuramoyl-L-alanine amidase
VPPGEVSQPTIEDVVDSLPQHETERYRTRSLDQITHLVVHHSATRPDVSAERMARYHVQDLGWPGIGYHFVIDEDGTINRTNELASVSYHAVQANAYSVGICFTGNFTEAIPPEAQLDAGAHLIAWLLQELDLPVDRIHGHREQVSGTTCPGDQWFTGRRWRDLLLTRVHNVRSGSS